MTPVATTRPTKPLLNPLSQDDHDLIKQGLDRHMMLADLIQRAEAAGLLPQEVIDDRKARNEAHRQVLQNMREHFFPQAGAVPPE